jgi:ribose transport system ATP-binding protein
MFREATALLERVGLDRSPSTLVQTLTAGQRQMVEVAKALSSRARIIIMDEPTSSLTAGESAALFRIIAQLRSDNIGIIYISHRLDEVLHLADRITVLRDGKLVGDVARAGATVDSIVQMMVGRELTGQYFPPKVARTSPAHAALEVNALVVPGTSTGVSFSAMRGEVLGFAGLIGAGRTELMEAIFGVSPAIAGTMTLDGKPYSPQSTRDAIERGVYLVPEDRKRDGLVLQMSVAENTSLPGINRYNRWGWLDRATEKRVAEAEVARLHTKTSSIQQRMDTLSGGNQQKVVLGKWLAMSPRVLILDEPTRGIDVGAKAEIYRYIVTLCEHGITVLMVSSELEEIIGMSDRVVVMHDRQMRGVLLREELTQERIAALMTGRGGEIAAA